jgi:hypothetical protein
MVVFPAPFGPGRWLVEKEQIGITGQGDRYIEAPLLAAGELHHPAVALVGQANQVDHLVDRPRMWVVARSIGRPGRP